MSPSATNQYSRIKAVEYAMQYAMKPNPSYRYFSLSNTGGDCANFVSQCLYAGGINMNSTWWYKHNRTSSTNYDSWSITWSVANSLYWYLKKNAASNNNYIKGIEVNDPKALDLGDLVFFEDQNNTIFHSAIVTFHLGSEILISHHSFEAMNIPYYKSWPYKKIHFVKLST